MVSVYFHGLGNRERDFRMLDEESGLLAAAEKDMANTQEILGYGASERDLYIRAIRIGERIVSRLPPNNHMRDGYNQAVQNLTFTLRTIKDSDEPEQTHSLGLG